MAIQANIPITAGAGLFLDAVSFVVGPNTVLRESVVIGDPSNATQLATVTAGGALNVADSILDGCITANVLAVSLPTAQIVTITPPTASAIAAAIVANPPTVGIAGSVPVTGTIAVTQSTSPWVISGAVTLASTTITGTVAVTQSTSPWVIAGNLTHNNAAPGATNIGALVAKANVAAPTYTEGDQVLLSTDLTGSLRVNATFTGTISQNITQWNSVALGSPSAYGTSPGAVNVIGVNAFVTSLPAVSIAAAQTIAVTNAGVFAVQATLSAETTKVIGTVNLSAAQKIEVYDGTNTATVKPASTAALATDTALVVAVSPNNAVTVTTPTSSTASSPASTAVGASSVSILASNTARKEAIVVNTGTTILYLGLGQTPSVTAYHVALAPCTIANDGTGGSYISDLWKGAINAIGSAAGGSACVTELT
jgi:hypothetical protein